MSVMLAYCMCMACSYWIQNTTTSMRQLYTPIVHSPYKHPHSARSLIHTHTYTHMGNSTHTHRRWLHPARIRTNRKRYKDRQIKSKAFLALCVCACCVCVPLLKTINKSQRLFSYRHHVVRIAPLASVDSSMLTWIDVLSPGL